MTKIVRASQIAALLVATVLTAQGSSAALLLARPVVSESNALAAFDRLRGENSADLDNAIATSGFSKAELLGVALRNGRISPADVEAASGLLRQADLSEKDRALIWKCTIIACNAIPINTWIVFKLLGL